MTRPSYNTGTGFYIGADNKLYDPSNQQFIIRGINRTHYDSGAAAGITKSKATAERFALYWDNFISFAGTPTYISATQFSVVGDQTAFFYPNGRVLAIVGGAVSGTVSQAVFTNLTIVTVSWDFGGQLDNSLSAVYYGTRAADFIMQLYNECYSNGIVAMPTVFTTSFAYGHVTLTGSTSAADLTHAVDQWVGQAAIWTASYLGIPTERWMAINIANEWVATGTTWRDSYITAISRMRAAGYKHTLVIDLGGDAASFTSYGQAIFDSDPQKNVIFSVHLYGALTNGPNGNNNVTNITRANPAVVTYSGADTFANGNPVIIAGTQGMTQVNSVDQANIIFTVAGLNVGAKTFQLSGIDSTGYTAYSAPLSGTPNAVGLYSGQSYATSFLQSLLIGLPLVVGEFGPGRNIGPSPTMTWPGDVIRAAEGLSLGWLAWAWDDNDLGGGTSDNAWFAMVYNNAVYNVTADLTIYGQDLVLGYPYSFQVANYPRANFTYSPGLQETPEASNWQAHHRKLWGRHKKKKDEDQERRELGILPNDPPQSVAQMPTVTPDLPREIIKPPVKRTVIIPRLITPPRIAPTKEEYDNAYKRAYKAAYMEAISNERLMKEMKRRERLRAAGIIPMEKGYGRRRGS